MNSRLSSLFPFYLIGFFWLLSRFLGGSEMRRNKRKGTLGKKTLTNTEFEFDDALTNAEKENLFTGSAMPIHKIL